MACFLENSLGFAVPRNAKATEKKPKKVYKVSKYKKIKTDDGLILSRANIFQYRYYNDDKKILKRLREAYVKPSVARKKKSEAARKRARKG